MKTSLKISYDMNLDQLAELMGGASKEEAIEMRIILILSYYNGMTTADVPDNRWFDFCDRAVKNVTWIQ